MDDIWGFVDVLALLEGGNTKFREFCAITNAYPTLESAIDDRTQFIDGLYASLPVKAYRSLLRKATSKALDDRRGLIASVQQGQLRQRQRKQPPIPPEGMLPELYPGEAYRYIKVLPMLSIYDYYTTVLEREWPKSEDEDEVEDDANEHAEIHEEHNPGFLLSNESENSIDEELKLINGSESENEATVNAASTADLSKSDGMARALFEEEKKDVDEGHLHQQVHHVDDDDDMQYSTASGFGDVLNGEHYPADTNDKADASGANGPLPEDASVASYSLFGDEVLSLVGTEGAGYSRAGEEILSLVGTEATEKQANSNNNNSARSSLTKYVQPLKEGGTRDGGGSKRGMRRIIRPVDMDSGGLASVSEKEPCDDDNMSLPSREEIMGSRTAIYRAHDDDDSRSVMSSGETSIYSAGSSVGSFDMRSLPDGKSVSSAEMEAIPELNEEEAIVKNLEPPPTQDSFRNLDAEDSSGPNYGPAGGDSSATDLHELESSHSNLDANGGDGPTSKGGPRGAKIKKSSLQKSLLKLDAAIGDVDPKQRRLSAVQRQQRKQVSFGGLPQWPPERINNDNNLTGKIQLVEKKEIRGSSLLEGFQLRGANRKGSASAAAPKSEERAEHQTPNVKNDGRTRRFPLAINGLIGPPVSKQSDYTPATRASYASGMQSRSGGDQQQHVQQPQQQVQQQQDQSNGPNRVVSAYKHQIKSLARNFNRQNSKDTNIWQQKKQEVIPEYSGNLAARAQIEKWDATRQPSPSPQEVQSNPMFGSFRSSSPLNGLFGSFRSNSPQRLGAGNKEENLASRFSQSFRGSFSSNDKL
jgi:hypothetical protein